MRVVTDLFFWGIKIDLFFVWVVEIASLFEWRIEIYLFHCRGRTWLGFCVAVEIHVCIEIDVFFVSGYGNGFDYRSGIATDFISVLGPKCTCLLCRVGKLSRCWSGDQN